ncbi:hypothetical protein GP486_004258 [Trichoglossum hirsutum]|uniref:Enhancer of mRNA-decapping protein 3 n=1 Tax=Trichoglossum hirsutum TaxID=265104 RepID=A0A9P8LBI7_9PEZI|nr:hypothetical protein GP486_004258 [Trichoglossum hirsutum]
MADQFIGLTVLVKLKSPPNTELRGLVANVAGQQLTLRDVFFPRSGHYVPERCINSSDILDLDIVRQPTASDHQASVAPAAPQPVHPPAFQQNYSSPYISAPHQKTTDQQHGIVHTGTSQVPGPFLDPAILSVGKKPTAAPRSVAASTPVKQQALLAPKESFAESVSPASTSPMPAEVKPKAPTSIIGSIKPRANGTSATLTAPFNDLDLNTDTDALETDGPEPIPQLGRRESVQTVKAHPQAQVEVKIEGYTGKRSRRGGRGKKDAATQSRKAGSVDVDPEEALQSPQRKKERGSERNKRLHQNRSEEPEFPGPYTPGVIGGSVARAAVNSSRRKARKQRTVQGDDQDGWATEEATDIQSRGDFDFQGNLSKFDKRSVFNQIKARSNTAENERLVSFNRLPKSRQMVVNAKNLSHSENVLGSANGAGKWNSEAGDSDEGEETSDIDSGKAGSGRSSRRVLSAQPTRRLPSRKGSQVTVVSGNIPMTSSAQILNSLNRGHHSSSHGSGSRPNKDSPSASPFRYSAPSRPSLRLVPSNRPCPVISPIQMLEVEHANEVKLGLTEIMMTENAARGIAEVAFLMLNPGGRRLTTENHNAPPAVVVLAGNNRNGSRAVAGGRHLQNHGVNVVVCLLDPDHHEELFEDMHRQVNLFCNSGGTLTRLESLGEDLKELESPPELIVDGLLGPQVPYKDLRTDDQATASELIAWARKSKASILAIDLPSGLDPSTGEVTVGDLASLHARTKMVVSMGVPKTGLLNALISGKGQAWQLFVADIGLGNTAWKEKGTRRRQGIEFGNIDGVKRKLPACKTPDSNDGRRGQRPVTMGKGTYTVLAGILHLEITFLQITHSEWSSSDAFSASTGSGAARPKAAAGASFKRLPFNFCAVSLQPFEHPVCTADGTIFDLTNILPWLKKHGTNPVTGKKLDSKELIKLNFHKNDDGEYVDPVTYKVFTDNTHIVALRNTGNVFAWDTVERLNVKAKMWRDLVSDETFGRADIITLQDPQNVGSRDLSSFKYLQDGVSTLTPEQEAERADPLSGINLKATGSSAKVLAAKQAVAKARAARAGDPNHSPAHLSKKSATPSDKPSNSAKVIHQSKPNVPYNVAGHTTGKAAASFTSTGLTPHTSLERALLTDEEYMLKPRRVKIKGYARIQTSLGDLNVELHTEYAPKAVYNFVQLAKKGYYEGTTFHRNIRNFMVSRLFTF